MNEFDKFGAGYGLIMGYLTDNTSFALGVALAVGIAFLVLRGIWALWLLLVYLLVEGISGMFKAVLRYLLWRRIRNVPVKGDSQHWRQLDKTGGEGP